MRVCCWCHRVREPAELIAFWPIGRRDRVRYVCRPSGQGACFRNVVSWVGVHELEPADEFLRRYAA